MKIGAYFRQVYPFYYENIKIVFVILLFLSCLTFLFIYLFEPFTVNVSEHKIGSIWIQVLHSFIPLPIAFGYLFVLKKTVKTISRWTLGKELLHLAIILLLIGLVNFLIRDIIYSNPENWSLRYFWREIRNTFLVGVLLLIIILPLNTERLLRQHINYLKKLPTNKLTETVNQSILIETTNTEDAFRLNIDAFRFAKVDGNYVEIISTNIEENKKVIKRMTLKELEDQLKIFTFIFKTHRSYMVNLKAIESISGNAQGYMLSLRNLKDAIPVSRSKIEAFNNVYSKMNNV